MFWYEHKRWEAHKAVFDYVEEVERAQCDIYERFAQLAFLYNPHDREAQVLLPPRERGRTDSRVSENVVARNVDAAAASIAVTDVRSRYMTTDGDWSEQRLAAKLEWYIDGLGKQLKRAQRCRRAFKDAILKGPGFIKVDIDWTLKKILVERVLPSDVIVDVAETRTGEMPRQLHQRMFVSRARLKARFKSKGEEIDEAQKARTNWAGYRPIERDELIAIESWYLPYGSPKDKSYEAGRHTICIDGATIVDEDWDEPEFPIIRVLWSEGDDFYGIGAGMRIAGHQWELNRINYQADRCRTQRAVPTTFVHVADAGLAVKTTNPVGNIVPYKHSIPQTIIPQGVSDEWYQRRVELKESSYEEIGQGRLQATGKKPSGLDSGAALREYRDQSAGSMGLSEKNWEEFNLAVDLRVLRCCKKLGQDAPKVTTHNRWGARSVEWTKVDPGTLEIQVQAASTLAKTPAGRLQFAAELAQNGLISIDEYRRLLQHPDLEHELSLYTAALELVEHHFEMLCDGDEVVPEPYQNLEMTVVRFQRGLSKISNQGAPEEILEAVREYMVNAAAILAMGQEPPPTAGDMPGAAPMPAEMPMDIPLDMPMAPPTPAIAAEAIGQAVV